MENKPPISGQVSAFCRPGRQEQDVPIDLLYPATVAMVFILCIIEQARLFLGSSGNKTETVGPLAWCLALSLPALVGYVYFMRLQIFVTRLDLVINAIGVGFVGLEIILGVFTVVTFVKARPRS